MKSSKTIINTLNNLITLEVGATNLYMGYGVILKDMGFSRLAEKFTEFSGEEREDLEKLMERVVFLDHKPIVALESPIIYPELNDVNRMLWNSLDSEYKVIGYLQNAITLCHNLMDFGTRALLENMLIEEESHVDYLETEIDTIKFVGLQHYLSQQMR